MKNFKIPIIIKFFCFIIITFIINNILSLEIIYVFHWFWNEFFISVWVSILLIIYVFLLLKFIKNPNKYSLFHFIISIILFLLNLIILIFFIYNYNFDFDLYIMKKYINIIILICSVITIFYFLLALKIWILRKRIKNKLLDEKYLTIKSQTKLVYILSIFYVIFLILFYIFYYSTPYFEFQKIDKNFYDDSKYIKNQNSEENWFLYLKNIAKKWDDFYDLDFPEVKNIIKELKQEKILKDDEDFRFIDIKKNISTNINLVKKIDTITKTYDKLLDYKYYITDYFGYFNMRDIVWYRNLYWYNSLHYIKNWEKRKWLEYLINNYKISKKIVKWHTSIIEKIVYIVNLSKDLEDLEYLTDNYDFSKQDLKYIKNSLEIFTDKEYNYVVKNNLVFQFHKIKLDYEKSIDLELPGLKYSFLFFTKDYYKKIFKEIYYYEYKWKYVKNHICNKKELNPYKLLLKKNWYLNLMWAISCPLSYVYSDFKRNLKKVRTLEEKLIEKIDKLLEEKEKKD